MQIYFVHRRKLTYVIILYLHCLKNYECVFRLRCVFISAIIRWILFGTVRSGGNPSPYMWPFFLVKGQSHYDIINLKNHYLYMWCQRHSRPQNRVLSKKNKVFFFHLVLNASIFIIAKLVASPSGALLTKYSVVY